MHITKTYKYKLRLTKAQEATVDQWIGTCRCVYNLALETKMYAWKSGRVNLSKFDLMKQLPELKKDNEWIKDVPSQTIQDVIERMDTAYQSFFKGGGFPKFAKRDFYNSILFKSVKVDTHNRVILPKIGSVKFICSRPLKGELRTATILRENNQYFISIVTKQEEVDMLLAPSDNQVGVDMGISFWVSLSDGTLIENPRHTEKYEKQLRVAQRSLARKVRGSSNYRKQKQVVASIHTKIKNVRKDFIHKQSFNIIKKHGKIVVEDLKVKNMIRFGHLSKYIADAGWSSFFEMLAYKADWYSREFDRVNPKYTSLTCNCCGEIDKMSRVSRDKFVCTSCGYENHADINAAKNILARSVASPRKRDSIRVCVGEESHLF